MLYLIYGNNTTKSHEKLDALKVQLLEENKNLSVFRLDDENFDETSFNDVLKANSLFSDKILVIMKRVLVNPVGLNVVIKDLKRLEESENIFILWEEDVKKKYVDEIKKYTKNVSEFSFNVRDKRKKELSVYFKITDLVAMRKKNDAWLLFQNEVLKGIDTEEVYWKILWQIRALVSVKKGGGKELHPFVFKKAEKACSLFNEVELEKYYSNLIDLYHKNRRGLADMNVGVEKFILKI